MLECDGKAAQRTARSSTVAVLAEAFRSTQVHLADLDSAGHVHAEDGHHWLVAPVVVVVVVVVAVVVSVQLNQQTGAVAGLAT